MNLKWLKEGKHTIWLGAVILLAALGLLFLRGGGMTTTSASAEERRIAEVLGAMAGAGKVEVALFYANMSGDSFTSSEAQKPTGAVVVAEGAEDMAVRLSLIRAVKTLLGLPETAVDVFVMEEGR